MLLARLVAAALLATSPSEASAQAAAPNLTNDQRATLLQLVLALKSVPSEPAAAGSWPVHLFRASDGSHYVAFSAPLPADVAATDRLAIYVRLAERAAAGAAPAATRSAVEEWLNGQRSNPLPMRAGRTVQVPSGELPIGGPTAMSTRGGDIGQASAALIMVEREQQRARQAREQRERERRAELEGSSKSNSELLPFEDFDLAALPVTRGGLPSRLERSLTAGPGEYHLVVSWATLDSQNRPVKRGVLSRELNLPPAQTSTLSLGSLVLADAISTRDQVYRADQQTAHPYAIGATEIVPAADAHFTNDERLAVAFQVLNASASEAGKPDVAITFRLFRQTPAGEQPSAALSPLRYDESTLPPDFNLALGHPILAAMAAPLASLARGQYRLDVTATDRLARASARGELRFTVVATPKVLLAAAPSLSPAFRRESFVEPGTLNPLLDLLAPSASTPALGRLVGLAREQRFAELLPDAAVTPAERGVAGLLQSLGFYALGDNSVTIGLQLRRAQDAGAPPGPAGGLAGAALALDGRDRDAIEAWAGAIAAGVPESALALPLAEAHARLKDAAGTGRWAAAALAARPSDADAIRLAAFAEIKSGREDDALKRLEPLTGADDVEAQWLSLHALFAGFVRGAEPGASPQGRQRFAAIAEAYISAGGRWSALAEEWKAAVTSSSPAP